MKYKKILFVLICVLIILIVCEIYLIIDFQNIINQPKIEAASAFCPFTLNLFQNIYGKEEMGKIQMVSTSDAYTDIISGKTDIIIATKPSDEQIEMIKKSNIQLEYKILYFEPLAIILNSSNEIDNMSIEEIQNIYYSNNLNWNTYQLEKNNGSQTSFESIVKSNEIGNNHYEIKMMNDIVDKVALDKSGIGYTFYSYYTKMHENKDTKMINVNNKNINDEDYPLLFEVYLIYRADNNNEKISKIINYIETEECKELIKKIK